MKIYNLYHYPSSSNFFFKKDPTKSMSVVELAEFIIKNTGEYISDSIMNRFTDWYIDKHSEPEYQKLELSKPNIFQKEFLNYLDKQMKMSNFIKYGQLEINTEILH